MTGPKLGIGAAADNQLIAIAQADHRLYRYSVKIVRTGFLGHGRLNGSEGRSHLVGVGQIQPHAADVSFVGDGLRVQLQHHRVAYLFGHSHRLIDGSRQPRFHRRDVVGRQHLLGFIFGQDGPAAGPHLVYQSLHRPGIMRLLGIFFGIGWGLVQAVQVGRVAPHVVKHPGGRIRIVEGWNPGLVENRLAGGYVGPTHPAGQQRLAQTTSIVLQFFGRTGGIGHSLRSQDNQHTVTVGSLAINSNVWVYRSGLASPKMSMGLL
jgi:hypothetical protein